MSEFSDNRGAKASFGFRDVPRDEKARLVRGVFDRVASRYDVMNDLMSAGVHRIWKSVLIDRLAPQPGRALLDMAGGTGDVARAYLDRADARPVSAAPAARAIVCDVNEEMLRAARARAGLSRLCADATRVPLPDRAMDAYSISFGIRNVTDIEAALAEARRVLRPGGRFACLEFSHPVTGGLQRLYDAYSFNVIPWLGDRVVGDRESYQYLVESIRRFPAQAAFAAMIERAGFRRVTVENLSGGVAALHLAWRI
ncbi:MAG: class I SAM-dependent methyltransferase [Parvularculaceae bacterium]